MPEHKDDIEKYLSGELTNAERHRLEKKALSDPFLADALEGAEPLGSLEFSQDLNQLHQKINIQKRNSFFWPLRIAAGVAVIISITFVTIKLTENETNSQLALQKQDTSQKNLSAPHKAPTGPPDERIAPSTDQQAPASEIRRTLPNQPAISEKPQGFPDATISNADPFSSASGEAEQDLRESEVSKEIIDDKIAEPKTELSQAGEREEKKIGAAAPSNRDRAADSPPAARSLPLSKKSEAASGASVVKDDAPSPFMTNNSSVPLPVGGLLEFNKYVENNLRYPQRALSRNIQGDVIIEFEIDTNGRYGNFEVIKGLGFGCDEEAIRLIKEGAKWSPAIQDGKVIDNKPRIIIPFRIKKPGN